MALASLFARAFTQVTSPPPTARPPRSISTRPRTTLTRASTRAGARGDRWPPWESQVIMMICRRPNLHAFLGVSSGRRLHILPPCEVASAVSSGKASDPVGGVGSEGTSVRPKVKCLLSLTPSENAMRSEGKHLLK